MLFSGSLRQRVDPSARAVGAALVAQKAVAIVAVVPPGDVHAEVHDDGALEDVVVSYDGSRFGFSCTCSMFEDGDNVCAHVWAVVLESENNLPDAFLGHDLSGELPQRTGQLWKRVLQQIGRSTRSQAVQTRATSLDQPERVLYVLDGPETRESGDLTLRTFVQKLTRTGRWGAPKPRRVRSERISELVDTLDRRLWSLLSPTAEDSPRRYWSYYDRQRESDNSVALSVDVAEVLFPILVETGRFFFSDSERLEEWRELSFDTDDRAWSLSLRVERDGGEWKLSGFLRRGSDAMTLAEPWLLLASGWVANDGKLGRLDDHGAFAWIPALRVHEAIRFAERDAEEFLAAVWNNSQLPPIDWPEELRLEEITQDPRPRLWLETCEEDPRKHRKLRARLGFDYGDVTIVDGHGSDSILDLEYRTRTVRDHDREANFRRKLLDAGFEPPPQHLVRREVFGPFELQLAPKRLSAAVATLISEGWHVEAEGGVYRRCDRFNVSVSSGIDWFDVRMNAEFDGTTVELPALLQAVRKGEKWVTLDDGSLGVLPEKWLDSHGLLLTAGKLEQDSLRFRVSQAFLLDVLLSREEHVSFDAKFEEARRALANFDGVRPSKSGQEFVGSLRPYQEEGLGWLHFLRRFSLGGCLADDMGLGKTVQVLALLDSLEPDSRPALVVVPRSLVFNWISEAARFTPRLRVLDFTGPGRVRDRGHLEEHDIVVTTYGTLVRDAEFISEVPFRYAVLDEAQTIKNAATTFAKAARLLKAEHRLALSGTPIENHLGELWSLFEFLNPGMLGTATAFRRFTGKERKLSGESLELLSRAIRPMILRRTKQQVASDLPERTEQTLQCELAPKERELYNELRDHYRSQLLKSVDTKGMGRSKIQILEALLRMRQAACHPGLIDTERRSESSAKVELLLTRLIEVVEEGHKALVFSQFTKLLGIVREQLDAVGIEFAYLDGRTRKRHEKVKQFQESADCKVFLISLKAGGLGLNLTAAEYVFLLDPWWNPASENQAIDRAHRIGQTRNVVAYRLIAKDTVEEKVLKLQDEKREIAASILGGREGPLRNLAREDLELLLG